MFNALAHMICSITWDICRIKSGLFSGVSCHYEDYIEAVEWAQDFARHNREVMMSRVLAALSHEVTKPFITQQEAVNCHHNYVQKEHHFGEEVLITRKGAVSAQKGQMGIIPITGAKSYPRGLGKQQSFCSRAAMARRASDEPNGGQKTLYP